MNRNVRPRLTLCYALALWLTACVAGRAEAPAAADVPKPTIVLKAAGPIVIDGKLDEPAWQQAAEVPVQYIWNKVGQLSSAPRMKVKYTWDDHFLYIGYETFDENLVALGSGKLEGPEKNQREGALIAHPTEKVDVVEFFISFGDRRFFWELHHNAANQFNDVWINVTDDDWPISKTVLGRFGIVFNFDESLKDDEENDKRLAIAARPKPKADGSPSTVNDASDQDTGYIGELRLPWLGLGAPLSAETRETFEVDGQKRSKHGPWKMDGTELMILAVFQNGDIDDHYHHSSPTFPGSWFHKGTAHWPHYTLKAAANE